MSNVNLCCPIFTHAWEDGTDNEEWGKLLYELPCNSDERMPAAEAILLQKDAPIIYVGAKLPPITYCPWCGKPVTKKK